MVASRRGDSWPGGLAGASVTGQIVGKYTQGVPKPGVCRHSDIAVREPVGLVSVPQFTITPSATLRGDAGGGE